MTRRQPSTHVQPQRERECPIMPLGFILQIFWFIHKTYFYLCALSLCDSHLFFPVYYQISNLSACHCWADLHSRQTSHDRHRLFGWVFETETFPLEIENILTWNLLQASRICEKSHLLVFFSFVCRFSLELQVLWIFGRKRMMMMMMMFPPSGWSVADVHWVNITPGHFLSSRLINKLGAVSTLARAHPSS